jgi:hypothetical protein
MKTSYSAVTRCGSRPAVEKPQTAMERFTITEHHLTLLKHACVGWNAAGHGAPQIDPERPYGSFDIEHDLAEIVEKYAGNPGVLRALHLLTQIVLQIALCTGRFETGTYQRTGIAGHAWRKTSK